MRNWSRKSVRSSRSQFPTKPAGGIHQNASDPPPHEHLADIQTRHDRLARARVRRRGGSGADPDAACAVHGDALVRQGVDAGDLARERRVELVAVGERRQSTNRERRAGSPLKSRKGTEWAKSVPTTSECGRSAGCARGVARLACTFGLHLQQPCYRELPGARLPRLPPMDCDDGDAQTGGEALLGEAKVTPEPADAGGEVGGRQWGCRCRGADGWLCPLRVWMGRHATQFRGLT